MEVRRLGKLLLPYLQSVSKKEKLLLGIRLIEERTKTVDGRRLNLRRQFGKKRLVLEGVG